MCIWRGYIRLLCFHFLLQKLIFREQRKYNKNVFILGYRVLGFYDVLFNKKVTSALLELIYIMKERKKIEKEIENLTNAKEVNVPPKGFSQILPVLTN